MTLNDVAKVMLLFKTDLSWMDMSREFVNLSINRIEPDEPDLCKLAPGEAFYLVEVHYLDGGEAFCELDENGQVMECWN